MIHWLEPSELSWWFSLYSVTTFFANSRCYFDDTHIHTHHFARKYRETGLKRLWTTNPAYSDNLVPNNTVLLHFCIVAFTWIHVRTSWCLMVSWPVKNWRSYVIHLGAEIISFFRGLWVDHQPFPWRRVKMCSKANNRRQSFEIKNL